MIERFILCALAVFTFARAMAADIPGPVIAQIARTHMTVSGQPIVVPDNPDVIVSTATFAPGAKTVEHKHLYPHLVYVMDGVLTVTNTATGKSFEVKRGDFVAEMQNSWHYGENKGSVPVKLFVIDEVPRGTKTNIVPK